MMVFEIPLGTDEVLLFSLCEMRGERVLSILAFSKDADGQLAPSRGSMFPLKLLEEARRTHNYAAKQAMVVVRGIERVQRMLAEKDATDHLAEFTRTAALR